MNFGKIWKKNYFSKTLSKDESPGSMIPIAEIQNGFPQIAPKSMLEENWDA